MKSMQKMLFDRSERNKIAVIVTCCEKRYWQYLILFCFAVLSNNITFAQNIAIKNVISIKQ